MRHAPLTGAAGAGRRCGSPPARRGPALGLPRGAPAVAAPHGWEIVAMPDHVISYVESDIPADATLIQWARTRREATPRRRGLRLRTPQLPQLRPAFA